MSTNHSCSMKYFLLTRGNNTDTLNPSDKVCLIESCCIHTHRGTIWETHFICHVPDEQPENELLACSTSVIVQVQEQIPHFHTQAMRSRFIQVFGLVTGAKPAILRDMYRQLIGDSSSAHDKGEVQIDERIRSSIDMEDPDVIIDLHALNQGHSWRYDVFWDICRTYIENTAGIAVDDRRHDHVTHLAAAMSVSDLRKQVCIHECRHDTHTHTRTRTRTHAHTRTHTHTRAHTHTHTQRACMPVFICPHIHQSHTCTHLNLLRTVLDLYSWTLPNSAQKGLPFPVCVLIVVKCCNFGRKSP